MPGLNLKSLWSAVAVKVYVGLLLIAFRPSDGGIKSGGRLVLPGTGIFLHSFLLYVHHSYMIPQCKNIIWAILPSLSAVKQGSNVASMKNVAIRYTHTYKVLCENEICDLQLPKKPQRSTRLLQLTGRWQHDGIM